MKHCFKKLMALLLATLMIMSAFSTIGAVAADSVCTHEGTWQKWVLEGEDESSATKAPTCEEPGYTYYKCTACGKVDAKDFVPATGHSYKWFADSVDGVACGDLYAIYEACEKCNKVRDWDPTPDGSNPVYNGQGTVIAPDNDPTPGYKTHNYDHYEIVTRPTCATHGELELICTHGGDCPRISVLIKRLSNDGQHTFDGSVVIEKKDATCTEDGFQLEACAKCYQETHKKDGLADEDKVTHEHNKDCGCPNAAATYAAKGHSYAAAKADFLAADVKSLTDADFDAADSCNRTFTCTVCETSETLTKHRDWKTENKYGATPAANACYQVKWCAHCETEDATTIVNLHNSKNAYDCNSRNVVKGDVKVGNHPTEKDKQACYVEYSCVECGYEWVELADHLANYPNAPEHGNLHVTVATDPTCTKYGTTIYSCDDCGLLIAEMTNPLGHEWDEEHGVQTDATCSTPGGLAVKCVRYNECGATETLNRVDPLGHQWVRDEANDVDHTCMTWGLSAYKCTRPTGADTVCGQTKFEKTTPPDGKSHSKDMYTVTTFPTCTEYGVATLFCKLCDMADSVTITWADRENPEYAYFDFDLIKVLGHDDKVVEVPATCSQPGYRKGQCTRPGCNYYVDEVIPVAGGAKGHHFELVTDQNGDIVFDADGKAVTVPTVGYYEGGFKVETDATDENAIQGDDGKYYALFESYGFAPKI